MFSHSKRAIAIGVLVAALGLSACSSSSTGPAASSADSATQAKIDDALAAAYKGFGSDLSELESVPTKPGINLYIVSCGEAVPSCASTSVALKAAADAAGWKATVADGKTSPEGFVTAIRQAIAGGADVIIPIAIGCAVAQTGFQEAADAGIMVVGGGGVDDCSPKLWAAERLWLPDTTPIQYWNDIGTLKADYAFAKTGGNPKAIALNFTSQVWGQWMTDGFTAELKKLGAAAPTIIDVADPEVIDGSYVQKITTALISDSEANVLAVPVDAWLTYGLAASIVQSGIDDRILTIGTFGDPPALDLIRQSGSGFDSTVGVAIGWAAWGSVDTASRLMAGQKPAYIGESMQVVDADNNMPAQGGYEGSVDYQKIFKAAWGVG